MKTPYKGIVRIACRKKEECREVAGDVMSECINCADAVIEILDLEGKTLARHMKQRTKKKSKGGKVNGI